ncbi:hypothetical protein [Iodidimonas sp. SYSU 1G8]|uniref:hypothetical protein n=1 Tax=Iodidimonas sp. SYSU 1G8 TaxID=3133967 RepID=UPI0031FE807C
MRARWKQLLTGGVLFWSATVLAAGTPHAQEPERMRRPADLAVSPELARSPAALRDLRLRIVRSQATPVDLTQTPATQEIPTAPVPALQPLQLGDARFVRLGREDEIKTKALAQAAIPAALRADAAVFEGVVQTVDDNAQELILKAVAFPRAPLRLNPATGKFEGGVSVGVIEVGGTVARTLSAPIAFQVIGPVSADPDTVSATQTAPPYREIRVQADAPDAAVKITVVSNVAPAGEELVLTVRPSLGVSVSPARIQGWGLETADVLVSAQGFEAARDNRLQLSSTLGRLSATQTTLDPGGLAQVSIRSESVGSGTISIRGAGLDGATASIVYVFPWRFLGAALIGGIVGGLLRKRTRSRSTATLVKSLGIAVLSAAVVVGLYVLGINLIGFALPAHGGEVLVFVVAALGALYGTKLLSVHPAAGT